jgi:hypothetical protein
LLLLIDGVSHGMTALAAAYLLFSAFIALSWHDNALERLVPDWVSRQIYPIDKTNLDVLRFVHFLAVAWLVRLLVPIHATFLNWPIWQPLRRCGEASLLIFCLGTFLALSGRVIVDHYDDSILPQIGVSIAGIAIMCLAAYAAAWFKVSGPRVTERTPTSALERQTATAEVLRVISQSPIDVQQAFDAIAESTARLCQAELCHVYRFDGELIHYMATHGQSPEVSEALR